MQHNEFTLAEIAEFISIWAKKFGELITEDRARLEIGLLMELYMAMAEPLPGEPGYDEYRAETDSDTMGQTTLE